MKAPTLQIYNRLSRDVRLNVSSLKYTIYDNEFIKSMRKI